MLVKATRICGFGRRMSLAFELHRRDGCPATGVLPYQDVDDDIERRRTSQFASGRRKRPNAPTLRDTAAVSRPASQSRERKANSAERQPKSQKAAKQAKPAAGAREGSMAAKVLSLLRRPDGASLKELMKAHGLVGAFCPQVPPRRGRQADEAEARVREERGRGAPLQSQRLNFHYPNPNSAAADSPLRRFLVQYPPGYDGQEHCDKRLSCANA